MFIQTVKQAFPLSAQINVISSSIVLRDIVRGSLPTFTSMNEEEGLSDSQADMSLTNLSLEEERKRERESKRELQGQGQGLVATAPVLQINYTVTYSYSASSRQEAYTM